MDAIISEIKNRCYLFRSSRIIIMILIMQWKQIAAFIIENNSCLIDSREKGPILCGSQPCSQGSAVWSYASSILVLQGKQSVYID